MFGALSRAYQLQTASAEIVDLATERRLRSQAQAAVDAMSAFRSGRASHAAVLAALVAPFN